MQPVHRRADVGPGLGATRLGDADEKEREPAQDDVGSDAIGAAMEHGAERERGLEGPEGGFDVEKLPVAQGDVLHR